MTFSLSNLQNYLLNEFGILPEQVDWDTDFRQDLHLTSREITTVVSYVSGQAGIQVPTDTAQNLTDVFDLMVYVLLRSTETVDVETYFNTLLTPLTQLAPDQFRPFGVALLHQLNLN